MIYVSVASFVNTIDLSSSQVALIPPAEAVRAIALPAVPRVLVNTIVSEVPISVVKLIAEAALSLETKAT